MAHAQRKDLGVRVAGEKAHKPDEFITKSSLVEGANITIEHLSNWDIRISATAGTSAAGGGPRDMMVEVVLMRKPSVSGNKLHYDIQDTSSPSAAYRRFMGTQVYVDIHHNWGLPHKDMFIFSQLDIRDIIGTSPFPLDSLPSVVGIDSNTIRLWATDSKALTRFDPTLWVDSSGGSMLSTKFVKTTDPAYEHAREITQIQATPRYRFRLTEVIERSYTAVTQSPEGLA